MVYCTKCGKKLKRYNLSNLNNLCKKCSDKKYKEVKEENKKSKQKEKELKNKIIKECKINSKIRELEKILKKPCMIEVNIANEGAFLFGRFVKRKFKVNPIVNSKAISKLKGEYKDIDDFCRKTRRNGFKVEMWGGVEVSLWYKDKRYNFLSDGIYKDFGRAGIFARMSCGKVADVKYALWKGK